MHDDRVLIERRIERILRERLWPAVHGQDVPLAVEVWHAPGEPVAVAEALQAPYRPVQAGEAWGPAWGTSWFHVTGTVPDAWAGRPVEAVIDLGFATDRNGFSAEALVHRPDGTAVKGLNPANTWLRIADLHVVLWEHESWKTEEELQTVTPNLTAFVSGLRPSP